MEEINIWEIGTNVYVRPKDDFIAIVNTKIHQRYGSKEKLYSDLTHSSYSCKAFKNILKFSYYKKGYHAPLNIFLDICEKLGIDRCHLQQNILSYKTQGGYNIISDPILPIKITPIFDMLVGHNIADGTVINCGGNRRSYFGYRQFNKDFRLAYVKKMESIFGKISYRDGNYYDSSTRPYCPSVLSQLFFTYYNLNEQSFLSRTARIPKKLLNKSKDYLLSIVLAFVIDEGSIDSTAITIKLKNRKLTEDLANICKKLDYSHTITFNGEYGNLYILRNGMKKLFSDYRLLVKKYPEANLYHMEDKIEHGFKIYQRKIYKIKGNKDIIFNMLKQEELTVNQIAYRINMTRQGVRFHIHNLEGENKIMKIGLIGKNNIIYAARGEC